MHKIRLLLAGALVAVPLATAAAQPASACPQNPCRPACHLNPPVYVDGDQIVVSNRPLIECYY